MSKMESEIWQNIFKVCSHFCTVATNVLSIQHCIYTSSCSCHIGTQHSSFQHRTLHRQYYTHATRPSEHQTTQAETIKTSTTCVMRVGPPLVLQPKQLSSICRIAVITHQHNIANTNAGKLHHPKVVSTTQLPVYLTTTRHKTTFNTTLTTSTTHHLFGNRTPALRSASTTTYVQHTSITEHTSISTFLPTFSQTPQQHYPAGHTLPHSMQPQCATAVFRQPLLQLHNNNHNNLWDTPSHSQHKHHLPTLRLHNLHPFRLSTQHHSTAMPCLQPPPHYNAAIPNLQLSAPQYGSFVTYQSTPQSTSTTLVQPLPATPFSQQFPTTTASTPPLSHNKHSRTRSRTTRKKHRSTTGRHSRRKSTKRHHSRHRSRHRSTTLRSRHHKSQHQSQRRRQHRSHRRQHPSNTDRSKSNHRSHTGHKPAAFSQQHASPHHHTTNRHRSTNRHWFFGILADWFSGQAGDLILYLIFSLPTTSRIHSSCPAAWYTSKWKPWI